VRDPRLLMNAFRARGIAAPAVVIRGLNDPDHPHDTSGWLLKPLRSGGGHRVRPWRPQAGRRTGDSDVPSGCYLQEHIDGAPGSVVFVAAGRRAVPLGISRQLVGEAAFGASGHRYCGNVIAARGDEAFVSAASRLAAAVSDAFDLVGLNGVDFVERDGVPYPIEVNPRWCGSMELVERAYGVSLFGMHAAACERGALPAFSLTQASRGIHAVGKAIVFARAAVAMGDTREWLADATVRDVPHPGERIASGHPICTVLAEGRDAAGCHEALVRRAERVYAAVNGKIGMLE
jgi:predicted ATP-grasp superfamily ATP-dependent carboligase